MTSLITAAVVGIGAVLQFWSGYGWVTQRQFSTAQGQFVTMDMFNEHVQRDYARVSGEVSNNDEKLNEVIAYVKVVPQLRELLKQRCAGNRSGTLLGLINDLKAEYKTLTGEDFAEPSCDELRLMP